MVAPFIGPFIAPAAAGAYIQAANPKFIATFFV